MKSMNSFFLLAGALLTSLQAHAAPVSVPGTSDPWLAGMPDLTSASFNPASGEPADFAPDQSPVLVTDCIIPGVTLNWNALGEVGHPGDPAGPDGAFSVILSHFTGAEHGLSDITSPIDALLGVFLGPGQPDLSPAPGALDFSTAASLDYLSIAPDLKQVFFMGDGSTSAAQVQSIIVPPGATRLFLGTMDGFSWNNNVGSFRVDIQCVPESGSAMTLLGLGFLGLFAMARRNSRPR